MPFDADQHKRRYDTLKGGSERANWESHCEEIAEYILPNRVGFTGSQTPGAKRMAKLFDSTGVHSLELLAAGLHGLATNPASKWFSLRMTDDALNEQSAVKKYLSDVEQRMWAEVYAPGTKFTTALHEIYMALGGFGTAIVFVGQRANGRLLFDARSLAECVLAENAEGVVDTVYRSFEFTVRQMIQEWVASKGENGAITYDWSKVSHDVKQLWEDKKVDDKIQIIHAVAPREDGEYGRKDAKNQPVASCYFEHKTGHLIDESGFPEFPYLCPRWSKMPGETYGRSPGMTALPDVKMLQAMKLTYIKSLQKNADPPAWIPDDGVMGPVRTVPGGINYYRGNREIFLHPTNIQGLGATSEEMELLRNQIRTTFYTDILQIVTDQQMTATEVVQRTQERMRLLGPMVGQLEAELLGPLVTRVFGILTRMGVLPEPPEEVQDKEFTVEYVSPIATAQKQTEAHGIMQVFQHVALLGEEGAAALIQRKINLDKLMDYFWDLFNNDPDLLKTPEELDEADNQMQAREAMPMIDQGMGAVAKGAGAVKQIADANAGGGIDFAQFAGEFAKHAGNNPAVRKLAAQTAEASQ